MQRKPAKAKKEDLVIDFGALPTDAETGLGQSAEPTDAETSIGTRKAILKDRERAGKEKALYVTISSDTFKRLSAYVAMNADVEQGKCNKSTVTEQALIEFLNRQKATE